MVTECSQTLGRCAGSVLWGNLWSATLPGYHYQGISWQIILNTSLPGVAVEQAKRSYEPVQLYGYNLCIHTVWYIQSDCTTTTICVYIQSDCTATICAYIRTVQLYNNNNLCILTVWLYSYNLCICTVPLYCYKLCIHTVQLYSYKLCVHTVQLYSYKLCVHTVQLYSYNLCIHTVWLYSYNLCIHAVWQSELQSVCTYSLIVQQQSVYRCSLTVRATICVYIQSDCTTTTIYVYIQSDCTATICVYIYSETVQIQSLYTVWMYSYNLCIDTVWMYSYNLCIHTVWLYSKSV